MVYLRFRNSIRLSGVVVTYWNPISMSLVASVVSFVALHVYSLSSLENIAFSRLI